jgi:hypothetical protein
VESTLHPRFLKKYLTTLYNRIAPDLVQRDVGGTIMRKMGWIWSGSKAAHPMTSQIRAGDAVQIRELRHLPLAGYSGTVMDVDEKEPAGPYVVHFGGGLRFRYRAADLIDLTHSPESAIRPSRPSSGIRILNGLG